MTVTVSEDFEGGASGWTDNQTGTDGFFTEYLGGFGANGGGAIVTEKTFDVSAGVGAAVLTFDFYEMDSWDGESFNVYVDGALVISEDFFGFDPALGNDPDAAGTTGTVDWSIVKQTDGLSNLGENSGFNDQVWTVTLVLNDPGSSFTLGFGSTLDQGATDESWGVDNLSITRTGTPVDAVDDVLSSGITEAETDGDVDFNVTANDTLGGGRVAAVDGQTGGVGNPVAGSNGGFFTINADGSVDFDAAGQFEDLGATDSRETSISYTIASPDPFVAGSQTATTSGTIGQGGQDVFFTFTAQENSNDGTSQISGAINLDGVAQPTYNILFVMDVSGSAGFSSPSFPGVGDENGDGDSDEVIDAEVAAFRQLSADIDALNFSDADLQIGFITFEADASIIEESAGDDSFDAGSTSLSNALGNVVANGGTDFEDALQQSISWFNGQPTRDNNIIFFLSDGIHNGGTFTDEVATLTDPNGLDAEINAVGITSGSSLTQLNQVDNTGGAQQVTSLDQLNAALQPPFLAATITDFRIFVDGVELDGTNGTTDIDISDLTASGSGFDINAQAINSITQAANSDSVVVAEVDFDEDGDGQADRTLSNTLVISTPSTDTATLTVTVDGLNDAPVAVDDTAGANSDGPVTIAVLDNDSDVDGDTLTIASVTQPANGTVTQNPDGTLTFDPDGDFDNLPNGQTAVETFSYTVTDGNVSDTATVTVTVTGVNTQPDAVDDDLTTANNASQVFDLTANDSDADGDDVEILSIDTTGVQGLVFLGSDFDTIFYDPNGAFDGLAGNETETETFTYTVTDGRGGTDTATVSITVTNGNSNPTPEDDTATVLQGRSVDVNVLANDSDPDGDGFTIQSFTQGANGTVVENPDGSLGYTPDPSFDGPSDSFTYTVVDDRGGTATATVNVTVQDNFPPFIPEPVVFFADENQTLAANVPAIDLEQDQVTYAIAGTGADDALFVINAASGELRFLDAPDFEAPGSADGNNAYEVDITVSDPFASNTQSITVNVTDEQDTPNTAPNIDSVTPLGGALALINGPDPDRVQFAVTSFNSGLLADVDASDVDPADSLIFTLFGEDAALFDLNVINGEITLGQPLTDPRGSFDGDSQYELDVLIEDGQGGTDVVEVDFVLISGA